MGPQYDPKCIFNDLHCPDSWLWASQECLHQLGAQLLSPGWLGAVQVMALGIKFGRPGRWSMVPLRGTYRAWPMMG